MNTRLHSAFWLWVPLAIIVAQIGIELFVPNTIKGPLHSEGGPHEAFQFLFALGGAIYAFRCLFKLPPEQKPLLLMWVTCFVLGCAYIAGEEVSWGQHIFEWGTPEFWSGVNDQNETNLHNTSSWLDQKPRLILLIGVVVGGLIIPFLQRVKPALVPQQFSIIYPPAMLSLTAFLALAVKLIDKVDERLPETIIFSRASEVEELYLFYFVLLYLIILHRRFAQNER